MATTPGPSTWVRCALTCDAYSIEPGVPCSAGAPAAGPKYATADRLRRRHRRNIEVWDKRQGAPAQRNRMGRMVNGDKCANHPLGSP